MLRSGDPEKLRSALNSGLSPNAQDEQGNTPLIQAAVYGNLACLQLLLDRGADVNAANAAGATPLLRAASDAEKATFLLSHGAKVNVRSALGNTPLMLAARPADSHRVVELLLAKGADVNATNNSGATALMAAAAGGDVQTVKLLLEHGADVNAQPGMDPRTFILGGGRSALMWASFRGDLPIMKLLLDAGADVNRPGFLGTPLTQAAWNNQVEATRLLLDHGAKVNQTGVPDGYTALHWAASTEEQDPALVNLLLERGADPNIGGGENVDAFLGTPQLPRMLAARRGETPVLAALVKAGAQAGTPDRPSKATAPARSLPDQLDNAPLRAAMAQAIPPLQQTSLASKQAFVRHASHQDCTSCHQQYLPMAAVGLARKQHVPVDADAERQLIQMVLTGDLKNAEPDWEALFHPETVHTKGYTLLATAAEDLPANEIIDAEVHHLAVIQGKEGQWHNNLPRPPIQTSDVGATALAVHALQAYPLPGRQAEFAARVARARQWLWQVHPVNNEERVYQILGLAWAGEPASKLESLSKALAADQRNDGGWAQLPTMKSDAYATAQSIYALRVGASVPATDPAIDRGVRYLVSTQLEDGTWYVRRRAFPFQPTMDSGFPHGRDSWISAAASSWSVMALSVSSPAKSLALQP